MKISRDYGVLIEEMGVALRGLFIIDPKGILRYVFRMRNIVISHQSCAQANYRQRPASWSFRRGDHPLGQGLPVHRKYFLVIDFPRLTLSLQDKYGEVCPANWTEGGKTIKADPQGSLEYFSEASPEGNKKRRIEGQ
jgi:peroxiredoxin (alkyl hydroperoxide reductase subunit C)